MSVFPSDLDVQAKSFFHATKSGKKYFCDMKGYVIPVFRVERSVVLEKQDIIDLSVWKMKFRKHLEDGCFREHTALTLNLCKEPLKDVKLYLSFMENAPFPKLEHLYLKCEHLPDCFLCR